MKTQEKELKPCPFCGAAPRLIDGDSLLNIACPSLRSQCCGPETGWRDRAAAIAAWNRRPASDSALENARAEIERLNKYSQGLKLAIDGYGELWEVLTEEVTEVFAPLHNEKQWRAFLRSKPGYVVKGDTLQSTISAALASATPQGEGKGRD